jgi:ORF6N domain
VSSAPMLPLEAITQRIVVLREQKILLDADLAALYGVETRRLNEQVRRNRARFPEDFIFELTAKLPMAFTEHGAIMAATVLNAPRAVEASVYVVRAFVRLRELVGSHRELAKRLDDLEAKTEALAMNHETFSRNTRNQLKQVFDALRELMTPPDPPRRPIGFIPPEDKGSKKPSRARGKA